MAADLAATPAVHLTMAALAGALGGWLRAVMRDETLALGRPAWMGTFAINMLACVLIGVFSTSASGSWTHTLIVMGLLGGYSTFSSMIVDTVVQWHAGNRRTAVFILTGTTLFGSFLATLGKWAVTVNAAVAMGSFHHPRPHWVDHGGRWRHHIGGMPLILAAGAIGNLVRVGVLDATVHTAFFWVATAAVNIVGSGLCAAVYRLVNAIDSEGRPRQDEPRRVAWERALMTGFCGGLTTMSTLALEIALILPHSLPLAILIWFVNVAGGVLAAIAGWWLVVAVERRFAAAGGGQRKGRAG